VARQKFVAELRLHKESMVMALGHTQQRADGKAGRHVHCRSATCICFLSPSSRFAICSVGKYFMSGVEAHGIRSARPSS
jgi:hypothetical protein